LAQKSVIFSLPSFHLVPSFGVTPIYSFWN